jgi:hypothetical protein
MAKVMPDDGSMVIVSRKEYEALQRLAEEALAAVKIEQRRRRR